MIVSNAKAVEEDRQLSLKGLGMSCESEGLLNACWVDVSYLHCDTDEMVKADQDATRYSYSVYYTPGDDYANFTITDKKLKTKIETSEHFTIYYPKTGDRHAVIHLYDEKNADNALDCRLYKSDLK
jgi:hypothetical protein